MCDDGKTVRGQTAMSIEVCSAGCKNQSTNVAGGGGGGGGSAKASHLRRFVSSPMLRKVQAYTWLWHNYR